MKKSVFFFLLCFCFSSLSLVKAESTTEVLLKEDYFIHSSRSGVSLVDFANIVSETDYSLEKSCNILMIRCREWKEAVRVLVLTNKEVMRDFYLGCKLGYHALSRRSVAEEIPDEVLIACYADVVIPSKSKVIILERIMLLR